MTYLTIYLRPLLLLLLLIPSSARAGAIELRAGPWVVGIDPGTLKFEAVSDAGTRVLVSEGVSGLGPARILERDGASAHWMLESRGLEARIRIEGNDISVDLKSGRVGELGWPVVVPGANVEALVLPRGEGNWVPVDDSWWGSVLAGDPGNANTVTEEFSMPFWGTALRGGTFTYILPNPFNTDISYFRRAGRVGLRLNHTFTRLDAEKTYGCVVRIGGPSPVEPARQYRSWLIQQGGLTTMAEKIRLTPRADRLPGAIHAYLWGSGLLRIKDVRDWGKFAKFLDAAGPETPAGRIRASMTDAGRKRLHELAEVEWPYDYLEGEVTRELNRLLDQGMTVTDLAAAIPGMVSDPAGWGDGISVKFVEDLAAAGIDRACLILNDLEAGDGKPEVARAAEAAGFLYAPYDDYAGIQAPGQEQSSTDRYGEELWRTGGIRGPDGKYLRGYEGRGRRLNALAARPYVESRVSGIMARIPFSAWFVDCDAYGEWFDDYSPDHPMTRAQDLEARIDRMKWISRTYGVPVGSEGGSSLAVGAFHFGHGVVSPPFGGWRDPDFENEKSKYCLGGWWPPERAEVFFKVVPLKERWSREFLDPRFRLPLYEMALHDAIIATNHWGSAAFKFKGTWPVMALLGQLYNTPPLYHFTRDDFARKRETVLSHYRFFSPLHRRLATVAMTGFRWLSADRMVQETTFADGTRIVANFGRSPALAGDRNVPAGTVVSVRGGETASYTPVEP